MLEVKIATVCYQAEIENIRAIRTTVFHQEQGIATDLEFDGLDDYATQFLAYGNNQAVGTARVREINQHTAKIERLAVLPIARRQGIASKLIKTALEVIREKNKSVVVAHVQVHIVQLYLNIGFTIVSKPFREAGIEHVKMIKQLL